MGKYVMEEEKEGSGFIVDSFIGSKKALRELLNISLDGLEDGQLVSFKCSCKTLKKSQTKLMPRKKEKVK